MYTIIFEIDLKKTLKKIPKQDAKKIIDTIDTLANNPRPRWVEQLKGHIETLYRIRVGSYRVIYTINDNTLVVCVVDVDHRKDVYR